MLRLPTAFSYAKNLKPQNLRPFRRVVLAQFQKYHTHQTTFIRKQSKRPLTPPSLQNRPPKGSFCCVKFREAAEKRHTTCLRALLLAANPSKQTCLHVAVALNETPILIDLLAEGDSPDIPNGAGIFPIQLAALKGQLVAVSQLIRAGARTDVMDSEYQNLLHWVVTNPVPFTLEAERLVCKIFVKIQETLPTTSIHSHCCHGFSPVHLAVKNNYLELIRTLPPESLLPPTSNGNTVFHIAAQNSLYFMLEFLFQTIDDKTLILAPNHEGLQPVHLAAQSADPDLVKFCITHGADIDTPDQDGVTPLCWALKMGAGETALFLVHEGAWIERVTSDGWKPLHFAVLREGTELPQVTKELIERSKMDHPTLGGETPLLFACKVGNIQAAAPLIKRGCDVNAFDPYGFTPLHFAARIGHNELTSLLIESGAKLNIRTSEGETPLILALQVDLLDTAYLLLRAGADIDVGHYEGAKAFHFVVGMHPENLELVRRFIARGADINEVDGSGRTPVDVAVKAKNFKIADHLVRIGAKKNVQF